MVDTADIPKAIVVFAGARDNYQLAWALNESGLLESLVTDTYWPGDRGWLAEGLRLIYSSEGAVAIPHWARKRYCTGLSSDRVTVSGRALLSVLAMRLIPRQSLQIQRDRQLSRLAKSLALKRNAALFCYSYYAHEAFRPSAQRRNLRFLFQVHPHPLSVRALLSDELERAPIARASLMAEPDLGLPEERYEELVEEPHLANGWVVASSYTRQSLVEHGLPAERVHVVPYGVDTNVFHRRQKPSGTTGPCKVIFVGSLTQRKGLMYLLEAVRALKTRQLHLTLCGRGFVDYPLLDAYSDLNADIRINLPTSELVEEVKESHIFVFPSLVEGFGHVVLQAMSCGAPVIATDHTCAPDVMRDGEHGFIVPIRDAQAISEKLAWGLDHRSDLAGMGQAAAARAGLFTWERFREGIRDAYVSMVAAVGAGPGEDG
jgi:glycosyltransferase involved in cell wall biosynthesis